MTWATSASVGMPFSISRSGAGAWLTSPSQARQAYLGRRRTSTLNCAGVTSSRSETSSPIRCLRPPQQMRRQRAAIDASLPRQSCRLVPVLLLGGFSRSERLFQILECERQLIGVEPFGPAAEAMALDVMDDGNAALGRATSGSELAGMPLALGQQQSPQSIRISRELIEGVRHGTMESHPRRFVAVALAPESPCRGLQRRMRRRHPNSTHTHPIKTFEKSRELSWRESHDTVADRRPPERPSFQPLGDEHDPSAVPEQQLHAICALGPEDVDDAAIRIGTEALAHHGSKSVHALTEIDRLHRDQNLHAAGGNNHEAAFTARRTSFSVAASTPGGTRTVARPITISMLAASVLVSGTGPVAKTTGAKETLSAARSRASRRQVNLLRCQSVPVRHVRHDGARRQCLRNDTSLVIL